MERPHAFFLTGKHRQREYSEQPSLWLLRGGMLSLLVGLLRGCVLSEEPAVGW